METVLAVMLAVFVIVMLAKLADMFCNLQAEDIARRVHDEMTEDGGGRTSKA